MLRLLTIHEAVPGHYLQLAHSNRCQSLVRRLFTSGVFVEGIIILVDTGRNNFEDGPFG